MMVPDSKDGVPPTKEYSKLLEEIDKEAKETGQQSEPKSKTTAKLVELMNDSDGDENFLLDELRVNKQSIFIKKNGVLVDDFDSDLKFNPDQIQNQF